MNPKDEVLNLYRNSYRRVFIEKPDTFIQHLAARVQDNPLLAARVSQTFSTEQEYTVSKIKRMVSFFENYSRHGLDDSIADGFLVRVRNDGTSPRLDGVMEAWTEAFLNTIADVDPEFNEDIRAAWFAVFAPVREYYEEARESI